MVNKKKQRIEKEMEGSIKETMTRKPKQTYQTLTIKLPKKLEKCLDYLETASKKSKEFIITEALIHYVEDMEDIQKYSVLENLGELDKIKKQKTYTTEELNKSLGI